MTIYNGVEFSTHKEPLLVLSITVLIGAVVDGGQPLDKATEIVAAFWNKAFQQGFERGLDEANQEL